VQFLNSTADDAMGLMFRIAVLRDPRRAELRGFRWTDAVMEKPYRDPETGEERLGAILPVWRPPVQLGGKVRESKAKTRAGQRYVFLNQESAELLREHRKAQLRARLRAGEALGHAGRSINDRLRTRWSKHTWLPPSKRRLWYGKRGRQRDRDGCCPFVPPMRRSSEVTLCR
jgi:hypothetical protein